MQLSIPSRIIIARSHVAACRLQMLFQFHQGLSVLVLKLVLVVILITFNSIKDYLTLLLSINIILSIFQFHQGLSFLSPICFSLTIRNLSIPSRIIFLKLLLYLLPHFLSFNSIKDYLSTSLEPSKVEKDELSIPLRIICIFILFIFIKTFKSFNSIKDYRQANRCSERIREILSIPLRII